MMKSRLLFWIISGIWAIMLLCSIKAEERSLEKRYIAALAKNNRLPKFSYVHKKSEESDDEPSMDETRFFLNQIAKPDDVYQDLDVPSFPEPSQNDFLESSLLSELSDQYVGKRNVAALARLGRLNTIRYGRFQPHYVNGKRVSNEDDNGEDNQKITDNEIDGNDIDCQPYDGEESIGEIAAEINGRQKKRYVAALARSGRLPIWHSQRMWSGKRDNAYPSYKINSRMDVENNLDNFIGEVPTYIRKQKKCQNINQYNRQKRNVDKTNEIEDIPIENINLSRLNSEEEKRNLAALARNGKLPSRYFGDGKRSENYMSEIFSEEKRNLAALARNGKLPQFSYDGKRNIAALARNGKLLSSSSMDDKRNVASLARNGKLPSFSENTGKRNLAALARNGKLPTFYDSEEKRNLAALARNGKLPSFYNGNDKRNIQALARNNKLPAFTNDKRDSMESDDKRNLAALAKNGRLPSFNIVNDKRNIAALARNGKLPSFVLEDKRNMAALARNGKLPMFDSREDKRNIAALAKNGKLPSFYSSEEKRNIAAIARNGKLPSFNSIEEKREIIPVSGIYDEESKRNIAALARKGHLMHFNGKKRNIAALARNGKLLGYNKRDSLNPLEKWDIFQDETEI